MNIIVAFYGTFVFITALKKKSFGRNREEATLKKDSLIFSNKELILLKN
jgi:hypothetical protein